MKTPQQNIVKLLKGKSVLFLENDNSLENGLDEFERILIGSGVNYTILFNLSELPFKNIIEAIDKHEAIVFQTRWVYEIAKTLFDYVSNLPEKKIVIECYINEPTWYYEKQHGSKHDVFIYSCPVFFSQADKSRERFYKLTNKPYWEYKNGFDN